MTRGLYRSVVTVMALACALNVGIIIWYCTTGRYLQHVPEHLVALLMTMWSWRKLRRLRARERGEAIEDPPVAFHDPPLA